MTDTEREKAIELLRKEGGARISEIAAELDITRDKARDIVNEINAEYELGSSPEFHYRILDTDTDWDEH